MPIAEGRYAGADKKFFTVNRAAGINTQAKREAIKDEEWAWIENLQPVGDGNYRSMYSNGSAIYTATGGLSIIYFYFFNVGATQYVAIFLSDGSGVSVTVPTKVATTMAPAGTFFPGSSPLGNPPPQCAQYGQSGIVIVGTPSASGYWAWDGVTLTSPGQLAPTWLDNQTPTFMPTGVSGTCVETFLSRVWLGNTGNLIFSAPGNGADYNPSDGAGVTPSSDSFLRREFTAIRQANGFLYLFGDSSINVISNVQTTGATTTFNNQNVDPQIGTPWHNSVQALAQYLMLANVNGVFALSGGQAEKVSDDLDGIFLAATPILMNDISTAQPSSAAMTLNDIRVYMILIPVKGPLDTSFRNALLMWDTKKWFVGSQVSSLTFIGTQQINSQLNAWGTDGTNLFPLFATSSSSLRKTWQTKLWSGEGPHITKQAMRVFTMAEDNSGLGYTFNGTIDTIQENTGITQQSFSVSSQVFLIIWQNASLQTVQFRNASLQNVNFGAGGPTLTGSGSINTNTRGNYMGLTMQSTSSDFTLIMHELLYQEQSPLGA
jgi:hypothetical protein